MAVVFEPVRLSGNTVVLIDQRKLPNQYHLIRCKTAKEVWHAIRELAVRGAPAIGIAAAYGLYVGLVESKPKGVAAAIRTLERVGRFLKTSRPTAVNLAWAADRIVRKAKKLRTKQVGELIRFVREEAELIHEEDRALCEAIGDAGADLIRARDQILVHCNAGGLATSGYGTALACLYRAKEQGKKLKVFATETRPLLQGARLTMWELKQAGIPSTLICDSAAGTLMQSGQVKKVIVGADRIARNGDTANKIGTYPLALLARIHKIPFYIAAPSSTFDFSIPDGRHIPIEKRPHHEVVEGFGSRTAPKGVNVYNPAFDVTPHEWISGFVTEKGVLKPPYSKSLRCLKSNQH